MNKITQCVCLGFILKNKAHTKALNVKEHPEGIDFYFINKSQACALSDFIHTVLPAKVKQSKQLVSHDQHSNLYNYKYTFMIEIAPVCKDDIIILDKETSQALGGIGPVLLCHKISAKIHLMDPLSQQTYEFDGNTYWKYGFKSYIDRDCLEEFIIINIDEEIDYQKKYANANATVTSSMNVDSDVSVGKTNSKVNQSKSTNYKNNTSNKQTQGFNFHNNNRHDFKIVTVQCISAKKTEQDGNVNLLTLRSHLGGKIRTGDTVLGYDLSSLNVNEALEGIMKGSEKIPDIILVKKKYVRSKNKKRVWKLKHMDKEVDVEMINPKRNNKNIDLKEEQYEEFLRDIEEDKDLRKIVNLYKDEEVMKELEGKFKTMNVQEEKKS